MYAKLIAGFLIISAIIGGWYYVHSINSENTQLTKDLATLTTNYSNLKTASKECSDSVDALAKKDKEKTDAAKVAVEQAKKEAVENYKAANAYLFVKPKTIVVTTETAPNYGGTDSVAQMQDYYNAHDLFNQYILDKKKK